MVYNVELILVPHGKEGVFYTLFLCFSGAVVARGGGRYRRGSNSHICSSNLYLIGLFSGCMDDFRLSVYTQRTRRP